MLNVTNTIAVLVHATRIFTGWYTAYADDQKIGWTEALAQLPQLMTIPTTIEAARLIPSEALDVDGFNSEERDAIVDAVRANLPAELKPQALKITTALLDWALSSANVTTAFLEAFKAEKGPEEAPAGMKAMRPSAAELLSGLPAFAGQPIVSPKAEELEEREADLVARENALAAREKALADKEADAGKDKGKVDVSAKGKSKAEGNGKSGDAKG